MNLLRCGFFCLRVCGRGGGSPFAGVCIDVLCLYVQYTCYICSGVAQHDTSSAQLRFGVIGFSRFKPPYPSRQTAGGLTLHKHLADDEVRVRDWVTTTLFFFSSSPIESCGPATTETSRERDTEAIDIPIASSPLLYCICLRSL